MVSSSKYKFGLLWGIGFVVFALVPVLMTSRYQMNLASHILIWGLFAVSFNMLWGVTGMLSFGQALYFGIGAYSIGLFVTHAGKGWYLASSHPCERRLFHHADARLCAARLADHVQVV
jgi:branched-chain amino acid transport system permease protein